MLTTLHLPSGFARQWGNTVGPFRELVPQDGELFERHRPLFLEKQCASQVPACIRMVWTPLEVVSAVRDELVQFALLEKGFSVLLEEVVELTVDDGSNRKESANRSEDYRQDEQ